MFRIFSCMAIILTHSLAAQADTGAQAGVIRLDTTSWATEYAGETVLDGLPVIVNLDVADSALGLQEMKVMPDMLAMVDIDTVIPSFKTETAPRRLNFIVAHNPGIQAAYAIQPRLLTIDGDTRSGYVSPREQNKDFSFVVEPRNDGTMVAKFARRTPNGAVINGEILLSPVNAEMRLN